MPALPTFAPTAKKAKKSPATATAARSPSKKGAGKSAKPAPEFSFANLRVHGDAQPASPISGDQLKSNGDCAAPLPAGLPATLSSLSGQPLPDPIRQSAQQDFGIPFEQVRLHTGRDAHRMANGVHARAFTYGNNIAFHAGQYAPQTKEGKGLLWHELGHIAAETSTSTKTPTAKPVAALTTAPSGPARVLRAPLYDTQDWKIPPLLKTPTVAKETLDNVTASLNAKAITSYVVNGAVQGTDAYTFLLNIIRQLGRRERWDTYITLQTAIGWAPPKGVAPEAMVKLVIDDKGKATIDMLRATPQTLPTQLTLPQATAKIKADYGISNITNQTGTWIPEELSDVAAAFALLPPTGKAALKGVELQRFATLGGSEAGEFQAHFSLDPADPTKAANSATLKLADSAFKFSIQNGTRQSTRDNVAGDAFTEVPASFQTILHEVGHAVETVQFRAAGNAVNDATANANKIAKTAHETFAKYKAATDPAIKAALGADVKKNNALSTTLSADIQQKKQAFAATQISPAELTAIKNDAIAKKTALDAALTAAATAAAAFKPAESQSSSAYQTAVAAATTAIDGYAKDSPDKNRTTLDSLDEALLAIIAKRQTAHDDLQKAAPNHPALNVFAPVDAAQDSRIVALRTLARAPNRTQRLQKFVTAMNAAAIKPITKYARDNWPHNPQEFYAEAYSLWLTDPNFIKNNYPAIDTFFQTQ
jgi:Domain of unknown function (DUF4157)